MTRAKLALEDARDRVLALIDKGQTPEQVRLLTFAWWQRGTFERLLNGSMEVTSGRDALMRTLELEAGASARYVDLNKVPWGQTDWRPPAEAPCAAPGRDPNDWFPGKGYGSRNACMVCMGCPYRSECLGAGMIQSRALDAQPGDFVPDEGIWGGTMPKNRRELYRSVRSKVAETAA